MMEVEGQRVVQQVGSGRRGRVEAAEVARAAVHGEQLKPAA